MPNVSSFGAQTDNAVVQGTVTDRQMVIPEVPPQGLMSVGPRQTCNFIKEPWNAQTSYVYYDVVKDSKGASYVATKPVVPAGTALTDENYWFRYADPNAQINDLQDIVRLYDSRISQNANDILGKAPNNHASEETVYGIGNAVNYGHVKLAGEDTPVTSDSNAGIAATPKMVKDAIDAALPNKKIVIIGDSFTDKNFAKAPIWCNQIAPFLGASVVNKAVSGCGYLAGSTKFSDQIDQASNEISDKRNVTHVIAFGSINDLNLIEGSNLYHAIYAYIGKARSAFPNAIIMCATPTRYNASLPVFREMLRQTQFACVNNGPAIFIDASTWLTNNAAYMDSTLHPTAQGQTAIASQMMSTLFGGQSFKNEYYANSNFTSATTEGLTYVQNNIGIMNYKVTHTGNYPTGQKMKIGQIYNSRFNGIMASPAYNTEGKIIGSVIVEGNYDPNKDSCIVYVNLTEAASVIIFNCTYPA